MSLREISSSGNLEGSFISHHYIYFILDVKGDTEKSFPLHYTGECGIELIPVNEFLNGFQGKTLVMQWKIQNLQSVNLILAAILYINSSSGIESKLYEGVIAPQPTEAAKRLFGDRISAELINNVYQVTIANLQFIDTVSLILRVVVLGNSIHVATSVIQVVKISGI